jgi:uncharacterized protein (TIGR03067 family)
MNTTLALSLAFAISAPGLKEKSKEEPTIVGEWSVADSIVGGKSDGTVQRFPIDKIVITAETWTVVRRGKDGPPTPIRFDPKAKPAELDFEPGPKPSCACICKIEGDTLTICYILEGERPDTFDSPVGSNVRLMILKRLKPEKP